MGSIGEKIARLLPGENQQSENQRGNIIVRTSVIGILANLFLSGFKAVIGFLTHSIAITMDAVNNLSDAASSLITIIGTRLAAKEPDKKHPFGHGRVEYLSSMLIAILVLYAGLTSLVESVKKILNPEVPDYTTAALIIVGVAVAVKLILGQYVKGVGRNVHSDSLVNSGQDALMDAIISASTLLAAGIYLTFGLSLEAWLGAVISLFIIKSGVEMLRETISRLLGEQVDTDLARAIEETVLSFPPVSGVYDLVLNNYGPDTFNGSVHIEVPDTCTANELDELIRKIQTAVFRKHRVVLTAVGVYSVNTSNDEAARMRDEIRQIALAEPYVLQMHGFYVNEERKEIRFDLVISFDAPDRRKVHAEVCGKVQNAYPDYSLVVALDSDFSEI